MNGSWCPSERTPSLLAATLTRRRPRRDRAFTLVELLVVVSIVALLLSILLPALKSAREQGKAVVCLANLKGVATASLIYSESDLQQQTIPVHPLMGRVAGEIGTYDWGGKAGVGEPTSGTSLTSSRWGTSIGRGPATRPLNRVLFRKPLRDHRDEPGVNQANWIDDYRMDVPLFRCPSDRGFRGLHLVTWRNSRLSSYDHYGTSYAANTLWETLIPM